MKHYKLTVEGKVQGVFFRASAKNKAQELGIKGTVKNMANGSVYIECEGNEDELQKFISWCNNGPEMAEVTNVKVEEGKIENFEGFSIKH